MRTDRQRVEQALPAALLFKVFHQCMTQAAENPEAGEMEFDHQVHDWLKSAGLEPFHDLTPDKRGKLIRRVIRLESLLMVPFEDRPCMTVFLVLLFWLKDLLDRDVLVLIEGSDIDKAISALIPELSKSEELWNSVEKSARKNAIKMNKILNDEGYYK